MKFKIILLIGVSIFYAIISCGQTSQLINTKEGGIIIFNNINHWGINFYIDYKKDNIDMNNMPAMKNAYHIGKNLLYFNFGLLPFQEKNKLEILKKNAKTFIDTLESDYKKVLNVKKEVIKLKNDTECLFFYYQIPDTILNQNIYQYQFWFYHDFAIIEVGFIQFIDLDENSYSDILDLMKNICENTYFSDEVITLEYLCSKRKE